MPRRKTNIDLAQVYEAETIYPSDIVILQRSRKLQPLCLDRVSNANFSRFVPIPKPSQESSEGKQHVQLNSRSLSVQSQLKSEIQCCENHSCCTPRQLWRKRVAIKKNLQPVTNLKSVSAIGTWNLRSIQSFNSTSTYYLYSKRVSIITHTVSVKVDRKMHHYTWDSSETSYEFLGVTQIKPARAKREILKGLEVFVFESTSHAYTRYSAPRAFTKSSADAMIMSCALSDDFSNFYSPDQDMQMFDYGGSLDPTPLVEQVTNRLKSDIQDGLERHKPNYSILSGQYKDNGQSAASDFTPEPSIPGVQMESDLAENTHHTSRWVDFPVTEYSGKRFITHDLGDGYTELYNSSDGSLFGTLPNEDLGKINSSSYDSTVPWVSELWSSWR
jgi:hypothetical protein